MAFVIQRQLMLDAYSDYVRKAMMTGTNLAFVIDEDGTPEWKGVPYMSQRHSEYERQPDDLYETPEWVTECIIPHLPGKSVRLWEPCAGLGKMVDVLKRHGHHVFSSDISSGSDFFDFDVAEASWIVTNPPFNRAPDFIRHALALTEPVRGGVAALLRTDFDHAATRRDLFAEHPAFSRKIVLTKRIVWFERPEGEPKAAPSFNHAWFIWDWQKFPNREPVINYEPSP